MHWRFLPPTYAEWVALRSAPTPGAERSEPPGGRLPWRVTLRWVLDSEKYNEWVACGAVQAAAPVSCAAEGRLQVPCGAPRLLQARVARAISQNTADNHAAAAPRPRSPLPRWMHPQDYEADQQKAATVAEAEAAAVLVGASAWC